MKSKELNEILNKTRRTPNISLTPEQVEELIKQLEVLEIIESKPQSELCLIQLGKIQTYEEYEYYVAYWDWNYVDMEYTEEEFNAIKEMFKYEK